MRKEFEQYIEKSFNEIYRFAYIYTHSKEIAEDVVSESVIKALKGIKSLKNPEYMKTWFYRIIINTAYTYMKKQSRVVYFEDMVSAENHTFDDYSKITLESLFDCLNPEQRSIVVMRFFEDMKIGDIAKILDINENTVKTRLYAALGKLKIEWEE